MPLVTSVVVDRNQKLQGVVFGTSHWTPVLFRLELQFWGKSLEWLVKSRCKKNCEVTVKHCCMITYILFRLQIDSLLVQNSNNFTNHYDKESTPPPPPHTREVRLYVTLTNLKVIKYFDHLHNLRYLFSTSRVLRIFPTEKATWLILIDIAY